MSILKYRLHFFLGDLSFSENINRDINARLDTFGEIEKPYSNTASSDYLVVGVIQTLALINADGETTYLETSSIDPILTKSIHKFRDTRGLVEVKNLKTSKNDAPNFFSENFPYDEQVLCSCFGDNAVSYQITNIDTSDNHTNTFAILFHPDFILDAPSSDHKNIESKITVHLYGINSLPKPPHPENFKEYAVGLKQYIVEIVEELLSQFGISTSI
jgi:hypothetical protein